MKMDRTNQTAGSQNTLGWGVIFKGYSRIDKIGIQKEQDGPGYVASTSDHICTTCSN